MNKYFILSVSLAIYFLLWLIMQPYFGYMLDADAVGYLSVAKRVINNDYANSINGLWSPMHSWLIALLGEGKNNYTLFEIGKSINTFFGGLTLVASFYLLEKFNIKNFIKNSILLTLPFVIAYYNYIQVFADLPQLALLVFYLNILVHKNFIHSISKHILVAFIIGLAFYFKSYSLIFFVLHLSSVHLLYYIKTKQKHLLNYSISFLITLALIIPWSFALKNKYGEFSLTGSAGKLNLSWYTASHKFLKPELGHLIPPPYSNSPSFWEDPSFAQEKLISPFSSTAYFIRWVARIIHTCVSAIGCFNEISCFAIAFLLISVYYYFIKKKEFNNKQILLLASLFIMLGYLAMHIETRYIWLNTIISLVFGAILISKINFEKKVYYNLTTIIFCLSYIVYPLFHLELWLNKGKENFEIAKIFEQKNIKGNWTSNTVDAGNWWVVAYLTNTQFYTIENFSFTSQELLTELKQDKINYIALKNENNVFNDIISLPTSELVYSANDIKIFKLKN